jgi:CubicO group peptidase (beta-lactamase class C family)
MPHHRLDTDALDRAFALAARQVEDGIVPFVILGVANAAGTIRLEAVPPRDGTPLGAGAVCLLASITKPIVTTTVLRLVQDGRFSLNAPLATWLPELAAAGHPTITAWHVLTHTTGLGEVAVEELLLQGGGRAELLRRTIAQPSEATPGSRFKYVTCTWELVAEAVERATGSPLDELVRDNVLDPLGMTDTVFDPRPDRAARMAPVRVGGWDSGPLTEALDPALAEQLVGGYIGLRMAGGGLWSTAADLLRFGRAMLGRGELDGEHVLAPAFVDLATREVTIDGLGPSPDRLVDDHYAIGWGKRGAASPASASAFGHGGKSGTRLWVDPEHDLVFVYLTGVWGLPTTPIDAAMNAVYAAVR